MRLEVSFDSRDLAALKAGRINPAIVRAVRKAGSTALRDMRAEAVKRIRTRKKLKGAIVRRALVMSRPKAVIAGDWVLRVKSQRVPLTAYPHRVTKRGVSVEVNVGKRTLVKGAFVATMKSGHKGVFRRFGRPRLPIYELFASRPVDALLHKGEAEGVGARGVASFNATFKRVLPMELDKGKG